MQQRTTQSPPAHQPRLQRVGQVVVARQHAHREAVPAGAVAVDATVGNGHDTLMLADAVGRLCGLEGADRYCQP